MGLLEDAIREHLELKRQHGANADEVARAERDALGPPGRPTPLEDTAAAHAAEMTTSAREAPQPAVEPFDLAEDGLDEPAAPRDDELLEADAPTHLYDVEPPEEELELFAEEETSLEAPTPPEAEVTPAPPEAELPPVPPEAAPDAPTRIIVAPDLEAERPSAAELPGGDEAPPGEDEDKETATAGDEGEETAEDVLEETPDFLQETPEHDRLWFEQKPPRDFDFGS